MATKLPALLSGSNKRVRVFLRTRPTRKFAREMINFDEDGQTVYVHVPRNEDLGVINNKRQDWCFKLDGVLHNSSQETVYGRCGHDVVAKVMEGYNGTIMAYGQTGAGKTHTMSGPATSYQMRGMVPRAIAQVFQEVRARDSTAVTTIRVSYVEIYNEALTDLLSAQSSAGTKLSPLTITEDEMKGVVVKGLTTKEVQNEKEALNLFFEGEVNRTIGVHALNSRSSRSHCVFTIHVETHSKTSSSSEYTLSKLNLVDLAGSERLSKTNSHGETEQEAMYINKSLSFMEQYVRALSDSKAQFKPFRQCKLTHLLKDSIGGASSTVMVANIWGEAKHIEETLSTLRFAKEMMCVPSDPVPNVHHDPMLLVKKYEHEMRLLKQELAMHDTMVNRGTISYEPLTEAEVGEIGRQVKLFAKGSLPDLGIKTVRQLREVMNQFKILFSTIERDHNDQVKELQQQLEILQSKEKLNAKASRASVKGKEAHLETGKTSVAGTSPTNKSVKKKKDDKLEEPKDQVGETDKQGFSIGTYTLGFAAKQSASPAAAASGKKSALLRLPWMNSSTKISDDVCDDELPPRPATPPSRHDAYETFKKGRGKELNKIFLSNKELLQKKRKELIDCSAQINLLKKNIDMCREVVKTKVSERQEQGELTTDDGRLIIDEQEYKALSDLKELKVEYRMTKESVQALRAEIPVCEKSVNDCRQRMLKEFDSWYKEAFIGGEDKEEKKEVMEETKEEDTKKNKLHGQETEVQMFERLQASLLKNDPATTAFYKAQLWTERRAIDRTQRPRRRLYMRPQANRGRLPGIMTF